MVPTYDIPVPREAAAADRAAPTRARWQLRLLGGFTLVDGRAAAVHRLPSRAIMLLLARLALEPHRAHGREEMIELLWPEVDLEVGRNRLRQALSALRSALEPRDGPADPVLLADRRTLRLVPGAIGCDVDAFRAAVGQGDAAAAALLYSGELLPGFFDDWLNDVRRQLAAMAEDIAASAATDRLTRPTATPQPMPSAASAARPRLPSYLTLMLGFEVAGAALAAAVRAHRLVVLRGPGGGGKTRLAVEVARSLAAGALPQHEPGPAFHLVVFVPLAPCESVAAMQDAVLLALRDEGGGAPAAVAAGGSDAMLARLEQTLADRRTLLVLDNFEQLVEVGCGVVAQWLSRLPGLHLLVTSRRVLGLDGEVEQALPALPVPAPGLSLAEHATNAAVRLFVDRARAARADFHLGERNHAAVAAIVRELQGLPLAIELAAARVRSLPLADILQLLQGASTQAPGRALTLLARRGPRTADDARHASMLRVVEWSWQHLDEAGRALMTALSVFEGGATLPAAAAVAGLSKPDAAVLLDEGVSASVAYTSEGPSGGVRFHLFEPIREYALMRLNATDRIRLHAAHRQWAQGWAALLGVAPSLDEFREELPNLLAALAADDGDPDATLRMLVDLSPALDDVNLPPSALPTLRRVLERATGPLAAQAHAILAQQSFEAGEPDAAVTHAERAVALAPADGALRACVLRSAARVLLRARGAAADAALLLDEALALARRHGLHDVAARALSLQAVLASQHDHDWERSLALKREALALWQTHGPPARVTEGLVNLALGLGHGHAMEEKLELLRQARESATRWRQMRLLAFIHSVTGYALADLGRWGEAAASYAACLDTAWDGGKWREWFYGLWNLPRTLAHARRPEPAALLMAYAQTFHAARFGVLAWSDLRECRRTRRLVRAQIGRAREATLWKQGRTLGMAQAMQLASREAAALAPR